MNLFWEREVLYVTFETQSQVKKVVNRREVRNRKNSDGTNIAFSVYAIAVIVFAPINNTRAFAHLQNFIFIKSILLLSKMRVTQLA